MASEGFSRGFFILGLAALLAHCTSELEADPCTPPVILELSEANTGHPIVGAQIQATNLDRTQDTSVIEWNVTEKIYRIYGSAGTYRIQVTHSEYQDIFLDSLKVEDSGKGDDLLKTQTLRIEVSKKNDSASLGGNPFRVKEMITAPRC